MRHRAVARRAGLPLASTTYYFSSLDDLIARAVEHIGMIEVAQLRARVDALSRRRRGPETTAEVLVDLLVGDVSGPGLAEQLISRYERHIACTRLPALRETMRRSLRQRAEAVAEARREIGSHRAIELVCTLICAVDGSVVSALVEGRDPRTAATVHADRPHRRAGAGRSRVPCGSEIGSGVRSVGSAGVTMYPVAKSP